MKDKAVILIVDDQQQNIELLEAYLAPQGYEIIRAASGQEALNKYFANQVDLVLLDVLMPGMSGIEVLKKLRADDNGRFVPVVVVSAHKEAKDRVEALQAGCNDFISKPVDKQELLVRVELLLGIKHLRDEVNEAGEFAENVINTVREPLIALDHDLRVVKVSRSFYDFFKVKPEETVGKLIYDLGNKQWDIPKLRELLETILPQKATFDNYEVVHDFAGIGRRIMLLNARQIERGMNKERIILLAIEDITERKKLAEDCGKLAVIVESSDDAIIRKDLNSVIESWNHGAEVIYGYNASEVIGRSISLLMPPDHIDEYKELLAKSISGELIRGYETKRRRKDGQIIDVSLTISGIKNGAGKIVGEAVIARDITGKKNLEREIVNSKDAAEAANKELGAFSYSVSHDLRAPLRHISGYVELLAKHFRPVLPEKGIHYLDSIADSAFQMGKLIDNLLQFSRTGLAELHKSELDMNSLVKEVLESIIKDNLDRAIEWVVGKLPSVLADEATMRQVWINLLSNAVKFTRTREKALIEIGSKVEGNEVAYFVRDNGAGFDMKYAQKLFGVFQRLHSADEFEGTGIGLANVQRIVLRHGGRVWAEAELNKGATFYFSMPQK